MKITLGRLLNAFSMVIEVTQGKIILLAELKFNLTYLHSLSRQFSHVKKPINKQKTVYVL